MFNSGDGNRRASLARAPGAPASATPAPEARAAPSTGLFNSEAGNGTGGFNPDPFNTGNLLPTAAPATTRVAPAPAAQHRNYNTGIANTGDVSTGGSSLDNC